MKTYYVQIDDCQNNPQAIVKVKASSENAARSKALQALHICDSIYIINNIDDIIILLYIIYINETIIYIYTVYI